MTRIDQGTLKGYAITLGKYGGDIFRPGAFAKTLKERLPMRRIGLWFGDERIGTVVEAREDAGGLCFEAELFSNSQAQRVRTMSKRVLNSVSIRYRVIRGQKLDAQRELLEVQLLSIVIGTH